MTKNPSSLWNQTAAELLGATASHQPTPGGGSIGALSGAFGAALVQMALEVSRRKMQKKGEELGSAGQGALQQLAAIQTRLQALADEDAAVFARYIDAGKQPKSSAAQQEARRQALAQAAAAARQTPLEVAQLCVTALQEAQVSLKQVDTGVVSDVGAGAALLRGAVDAALLTLDINIAGLKGEERAQWLQRRGKLAEQAQTLGQAVLDMTRQQIGVDPRS